MALEQQDKNQAAAHKTAHAPKPALPDWESAVEILDEYDGFVDLLSPLADDLGVFGESAKKKKKFLTDGGQEEERRQLRDRLTALSNLLGRSDVSNAQQLRAAALDKLDNNESLIKKNQLKITNYKLKIDF